jgi:tetratricopeptide (TPR) repeat protein
MDCLPHRLKKELIMLKNVSPKVIHKIMAAEGYLELGMPIQALEALHAIEDAGPLEAMRLYLIGEAFLRQEKYQEAIEPLHQAARLFPVMESRKAWSTLSDCFRLGGYEEMAEVAFLTAEAVEEIEVTYETLYQEQVCCPFSRQNEFSSRMTDFSETSNRVDGSRIPR